MEGVRAALLRRFGITEAARIGAGGESIVYGLDAARVLRVPKAGTFDVAALARQRDLLDAIDGRLPFATPRIEEIDAGHVIERRLPGRSMLALLPDLSGERRALAWANYLAAAEAVSQVAFPERDFGQVIAAPPLTAPTWRGYLEASLMRFAERNRATIAREVGEVDVLIKKALALIDGVPRDPPRALVHGDFFPGNVLLADDLSVSAVIDFSGFTLVGDPLYDVAGACVFPEMIAETTAEDVALLASEAGKRMPPQALAFYRAYFAFFSADPTLAASPYPGMHEWGVRALRALKAERRGWPAQGRP
ncbi:MAG: aminoglycoside phosphotransferase family protein [Rhizobiales bacterium]|nr:aminoglycoside phosphotransferase family protein [Hyphomicrobiales bacterium]